MRPCATGLPSSSIAAYSRICSGTGSDMGGTGLPVMTEKLVWRLGNVTQETLIVHPDRTNTIEVTAYNGAGLLATPPLRIAIDKCAFLLRCVPGTAQEGWIYYVVVVRRSGRQGKALRSVRFCRAIQIVNCQH